MDVITQEDAGAQQPIWSEAEIIDVCAKLVAKRANCDYLDVARAMVLLRLFDERNRKGAIRLARILQIERQVEDDWIRGDMQAWVTRVAAYFDRQPVEKKDRRPNGRRISHEDWERIADLVASEPVRLKGKKLKERIDQLAHTTDGWRHLRKISESTLSRNARRIEQLVRRKRRGGGSPDGATAGGEDATIENAAKSAQDGIVASGQLEPLGSESGVPTTGGAIKKEEEFGRLLSANDVPPPIRREAAQVSGADRHKNWTPPPFPPNPSVGEDVVYEPQGPYVSSADPDVPF
jgi:hypothetical protein